MITPNILIVICSLLAMLGTVSLVITFAYLCIKKNYGIVTKITFDELEEDEGVYLKYIIVKDALGRNVRIPVILYKKPLPEIGSTFCYYSLFSSDLRLIGHSRRAVLLLLAPLLIFIIAIFLIIMVHIMDLPTVNDPEVIL
jgi:hypothetical protein